MSVGVVSKMVYKIFDADKTKIDVEL